MEFIESITMFFVLLFNLKLLLYGIRYLLLHLSLNKSKGIERKHFVLKAFQIFIDEKISKGALKEAASITLILNSFHFFSK